MIINHPDSCGKQALFPGPIAFRRGALTGVVLPVLACRDQGAAWADS